MTEVKYLWARFDNAQIKYLKRDKVAAVDIAFGGAMDTLGEVVIFFAGDEMSVKLTKPFRYVIFITIIFIDISARSISLNGN